MQNHPLNKVVFIQKVAAFTNTEKLVEELFRLAYVNNSWNDTIKNYAFHLFEKQFESTDFLEAVCRRVIKSGVIWFADVVMSSQTLPNRIDLPRLACKNKASSVAMMKLVFEKVDEAGGKELLKNQLVAATKARRETCLMHCCYSFSSPEIIMLLFDKIVEVGGGGVGGTEMLKEQLTSTTDRYGMNCLMISCRYSSLEVVKVIFEKIDEVCGCANKMKRQLLTATEECGWNCLMLGCINSSGLEVVKFLFEKIVEVGGGEFLKSQFAATDNNRKTCLMLVCRYSSSPEVLKLVFEKIVEAGGTELLKRQIIAIDGGGWRCLSICCEFSRSPELMKLLAVVMFYLDLFQQQYENLGEGAKGKLRKMAQIKDASWIPDPESIAEVQKYILRC